MISTPVPLPSGEGTFFRRRFRRRFRRLRGCRVLVEPRGPSVSHATLGASRSPHSITCCRHEQVQFVLVKFQHQSHRLRELDRTVGGAVNPSLARGRLRFRRKFRRFRGTSPGAPVRVLPKAPFRCHVLVEPRALSVMPHYVCRGTSLTRKRTSLEAYMCPGS